MNQHTFLPSQRRFQTESQNARRSFCQLCSTSLSPYLSTQFQAFLGKKMETFVFCYFYHSHILINCTIHQKLSQTFRSRQTFFFRSDQTTKNDSLHPIYLFFKFTPLLIIVTKKKFSYKERESVLVVSLKPIHSSLDNIRVAFVRK